MPKPPRNWPLGALPRMLDTANAAYYVGLSPAAFLSRVKDGQYPAGHRDGGRVMWDRMALDDAIDLATGYAHRNDSDGNGTDRLEEARALAAIRGA